MKICYLNILVKKILYLKVEIMKTKIYELADAGHYKYNMYAELNPNLAPSPFLYGLHPICCEIIKFRLGSHYLPIETGRWNRTPRQERICTNCKVLGYEKAHNLQLYIDS